MPSARYVNTEISVERRLAYDHLLSAEKITFSARRSLISL